MNEDEKTKRREELDKRRNELLSLENEVALDEKIDEETLNKKIGDLTVKEFLEVISKTTGGTSNNSDIFSSTMEMMQNNPALMKNMMGLMGNMRF